MAKHIPFENKIIVNTSSQTVSSWLFKHLYKMQQISRFQHYNRNTRFPLLFFRKGFSYLIYSYYISFVTSSASVLEHNPVSLLLGDGACLNLFRSQVMYCKRSQKIHKKLKLSVCQLAIFGFFLQPALVYPIGKMI